MEYKPFQFFASLRLLTIAICAGFRHVVLQLSEPWDKVPELFFNIFTFLG